MATLKNIGYTLLILACIALAFVAIPVIGFVCSMLLVAVGVAFLAYFIYIGVVTLNEMEVELKKAANKKHTP